MCLPTGSRILATLPLLLAVGLGTLLPLPIAAQPAERCFAETGQCLSGPFLAFWAANGGLPVFGFPITPAQPELNRDTGQTVLTQWLERNRFELHADRVLLGRLGDDRLRQLGVDWQGQPRAAERPECLFFERTGHNVCDQAEEIGFVRYYVSHGLADPSLDEFGRSLALFGLPLTEARPERAADGTLILTQWFERARFEWHPGNPDEFKVLLGLLGKEVVTARLAAPPPPGLPGITVAGRVSDPAPAQRSTVTVYGVLTENSVGVTGVPMVATWNYQTTTSTCEGVTDATGEASCTRTIGSATIGYTVRVELAFAYRGQTYRGSTSFTPR